MRVCANCGRDWRRPSAEQVTNCDKCSLRRAVERIVTAEHQAASASEHTGVALGGGIDKLTEMLWTYLNLRHIRSEAHLALLRAGGD